MHRSSTINLPLTEAGVVTQAEDLLSFLSKSSNESKENLDVYNSPNFYNKDTYRNDIKDIGLLKTKRQEVLNHTYLLAARITNHKICVRICALLRHVGAINNEADLILNEQLGIHSEINAMVSVYDMDRSIKQNLFIEERALKLFSSLESQMSDALALGIISQFTRFMFEDFYRVDTRILGLLLHEEMESKDDQARVKMIVEEILTKVYLIAVKENNIRICALLEKQRIAIHGLRNTLSSNQRDKVSNRVRYYSDPYLGFNYRSDARFIFSFEGNQVILEIALPWDALVGTVHVYGHRSPRAFLSTIIRNVRNLDSSSIYDEISESTLESINVRGSNGLIILIAIVQAINKDFKKFDWYTPDSSWFRSEVLPNHIDPNVIQRYVKYLYGRLDSPTQTLEVAFNCFQNDIEKSSSLVNSIKVSIYQVTSRHKNTGYLKRIVEDLEEDIRCILTDCVYFTLPIQHKLLTVVADYYQKSIVSYNAQSYKMFRLPCKFADDLCKLYKEISILIGDIKSDKALSLPASTPIDFSYAMAKLYYDKFVAFDKYHTQSAWHTEAKRQDNFRLKQPEQKAISETEEHLRLATDGLVLTKPIQYWDRHYASLCKDRVFRWLALAIGLDHGVRLSKFLESIDNRDLTVRAAHYSPVMAITIFENNRLFLQLGQSETSRWSAIFFAFCRSHTPNL